MENSSASGPPPTEASRDSAPVGGTRTAPRSRWLRRLLMGLGGGSLCLVLLAVAGGLMSRRAFAEVKPSALRLANQFALCSLAGDRACVLRLSTWDAATLDKGARLVAAIERKLGKRGEAKLDENSLRYMRHASFGKNALRWRIQLQLRVGYEHADAVSERYLLEDRGEGLKVVRMDWNSDALILRD